MTAAETHRPGRDGARRAALLDAADRIVRRDGPGASVSVIAAAAGVTKPVLYRHFGDKSGLYRALAERHTERLLVTLRAALRTRTSRRDRFVAAIGTYLSAIQENPQIYRLLMDRPGVDDPAVAGQVTTFVRVVADEVAAGIAGEMRLPPERMPTALAWAHGMVGLVRGAGDWWLQDGTLSREELTEQLTDLLFGALNQHLRLEETPPAGIPV